MNLELPKPTVDIKEIRRLYHQEAEAASNKVNAINAARD
jgi:hypothetical protein